MSETRCQFREKPKIGDNFKTKPTNVVKIRQIFKK